MPVLENAKEEKFVQCIIAGMSQRKAYREAFKSSLRWKDETVDVKACNLYKKGKVAARYKELQERAVNKAIITREQRMSLLTEIAIEDESTVNKIKAIDTLNKMDGQYTNKVELTGGVNLSVEDKKEAAEKHIRELLENE